MDINDVVVLQVDLPEENLQKGMRGVIVTVFDVPELAYEIEFCADNGETIAEVALKPEQFEAL
ncbi:DUF4926 domain-containing protein [Vibrio neptunius]|uniref:DUF4926 domain-containing protein n=1 Tax=Vibrio neptunius TaxID=170651 RepID=UPI0019D1D8E3|nr:DUF4926 domain-containing protein [Vibrio neptunius]